MFETVKSVFTKINLVVVHSRSVLGRNKAEAEI
jgi:hypothetical protein